MKLDGGYGEIGNESMYLFLSVLTEDDRKKEEARLREENETAFLEFKEWLKDFEGLF